jgi:hypothetical protein
MNKTEHIFSVLSGCDGEEHFPALVIYHDISSLVGNL